MSKIFKICLIDQTGVKKTYIFDGNNEETFSKESESVETISEFIHKDDSIRRIKEKIFLNCNLNASISEIYLFSLTSKILNPEVVYNRLTQNDMLDLTYFRLVTFIKNIIKEESEIFSEKNYALSSSSILDNPSLIHHCLLDTSNP